MKIAFAQTNPRVGDFSKNVETLIDLAKRASQKGARLFLSPELSSCGYPPLDLVENGQFEALSAAAFKSWCEATAGLDCYLATGWVRGHGVARTNSVVITYKGKIVFEQAKSLLPTYDVFDESRYFAPATETQVLEIDGKRVVFGICEDFWGADPQLAGRYSETPVERMRKLKPDLICAAVASPFDRRKRERREALHSEIARALGAPLVYCNQVGATDALLFDGEGFVVDQVGELIGRAQAFGESLCFWEMGAAHVSDEAGTKLDRAAIDPLEVLFLGLKKGVQDYFRKTGFSRAVLGLSGGIDSALVATLAVAALGKDNVLGVAMPGPFSSSHSLEDAADLARRLGMRCVSAPIKFLYSAAVREWSQVEPLSGVALENLQSRLRGMTLMTFANHRGDLVLTTGNKSEIAMGYATLYGDMAGALGPIGDLYKTEVYELSRAINLNSQKWMGLATPPIPERSISKPPSAELRADQTDQDSLPPYDELDAVLREMIEGGASFEALSKRFKHEWLAKVWSGFHASEFKRAQAAPLLRVSHKAFGVGRRVPIAKKLSPL